jgi:hypothetical protein
LAAQSAMPSRGLMHGSILQSGIACNLFAR